MKEEMILLLLHSLTAVASSPCRRGATFSEAVVFPAVDGSGVLRVPGAASLPQCVAACCGLPGFELAWMFRGRCFVLSCRRREDCRPRQRPGADSVLAFLRRAAPPLLLPYGDGWEPLPRASEGGSDLEALEDLALFDLGGAGPELDSREGFNQSEAEDGPEGGPTQTAVAPVTPSSGGAGSHGDEGGASRPTGPDAAEKTTLSGAAPTSPTPSADSAPRVRSSVSAPPAEETVVTTATAGTSSPTALPLTSSPGNPVEPTPSTEKPDVSVATEDVSDIIQAPPPTVLQAPPPTSLQAPPPTVLQAPPPTSLQAPPPTVLQAPPPTVLQAPPPTSLQAPPPTVLQAPPPTSLALAWTVTSDPTGAPSAASVAATTPPAADAGGSKRGPQAVVGPDRKLFLPLSSVLLNGSGSEGGAYSWEAVSGPPGLKLQRADEAVATATGFRAGRYTFRLTAWDGAGATDSALLTLSVLEARSPPPVAHASGSHTLTLPNNSLVLRGSVTDGDQTQVHFLWTRDRQSPAAGAVLYGSAGQACLYLADLVEGTYLFRLRVTDAQGRSSAATATVEVRPEPGGGEQVELEMLVSVSQVSVAQKDTLVRQLAALIHVLDRDVQVRALQGRSHLSTVLQFSVQGPSGPLAGAGLAVLLKNQLLREKSDYLLFRVLRVDTVVCQLGCSGRGQCHPITKQCSCDPFWTENLIRRYLGDGESNCEWRILYVVLSSFILVIVILVLSWTFICCCRRSRQPKGRRKTKYTILDNMDEQERVELRPRFSIKHRSTEHNSSLMMSESELDSDPEARPVRSRNRVGAARNGNAFG